jgi:hypothetical protein
MGVALTQTTVTALQLKHDALAPGNVCRVAVVAGGRWPCRLDRPARAALAECLVEQVDAVCCL